jgi:hypothetical protein
VGRLLDVEQDKKERHDGCVREERCNSDGEAGIALVLLCIPRQ